MICQTGHSRSSSSGAYPDCCRVVMVPRSTGGDENGSKGSAYRPSITTTVALTAEGKHFPWTPDQTFSNSTAESTSR